MKFKQFLLSEIQIDLPYHNIFNPDLFNEFTLKPEIRKKLLKYAEEFRYKCNVVDILDKKDVQDIILTGGNANYNYSDKSDIDVHLITDLEKLPEALREPAKFIFKQQKKLWLLERHPMIKNYAVELYIQDASEQAPINQGAYSLLKNKWVQQPTNLELDMENDVVLQQKVNDYSDAIEKGIKDNDIKGLKNLRTKIKDMRSEGLKQGGEFSPENQVFKALRNAGLFDRMNQAIQNWYYDNV